MNVKRLTDRIAQGAVAGKRVFIRADLNVPQDDAGHITEDTRIRASVPCIRMALDAGAVVMVTSHLGRPTEAAFKPEGSLAPVAKRLGELLGREVPLVSNWVDGVSVAPGSRGRKSAGDWAWAAGIASASAAARGRARRIMAFLRRWRSRNSRWRSGARSPRRLRC